MKCALWIVAGSLLLTGCNTQSSTIASSSSDSSAPAASNPSDSSAPSIAAAPSALDAQTGNVVKLTPANAKIQFVGKHTDSKPDRVGTFQKFSGQALLSDDSRSLQSVTVDIEAGSFETFDPKLTAHLNSPDFLDTRSHPTITFKSNRVFVDDEGRTQIVGDLTVHGVTKEVSFPADVTIEDRQLSLKSELTIDRTEFSMDRMLQGVKNEVDITVLVGKHAKSAGTTGAAE